MPILASALSGILQFMAFPSYDLALLGWVGLVPLFAGIQSKRPLHAFLLAWITGIVFFAGHFSWVFQIPGYKLFHHTLLIPYMGLFSAIFGLTFSFVEARRGLRTALFSTPLIWVSLEYVRANFGFLALPWAMLGHSQYQFPTVIQFASFTGAYGVSFLLVMINAVLFWVFRAILKGERVPRSAVVVSALLTCLVLSYGYLETREPISTKTIRTAVIQSNISREMKANPKGHANFIIEKHEYFTRQATKDRPALIVWPEAATPGLVLKNVTLLNRMVSFIKETGSFFLIGSSEYPKFIRHTSQGPQGIGNTALLFSPEGKILEQYLKIHLVPFGEYVPYEGIVPWPEFIVPMENKSYEVPGKDYTLFEINTTKFGVLICWEIVFPNLFRQFVRKGADFMLNVTNEGWFGETAAPYQLAAVCVFRAVENQVSLARAANNGISCFIDPYGRITGRVENHHKDIFVEGYLTQEVPLRNKESFYTAYGDVFVYFVLGITAIVIVLSFWGSRPK
jgi:apolipoprotein N-acyltransferase